MAQTPSTVGLFTTVKNTSGKTRVFGYLGERGKRLTSNQSFTVRGDLLHNVAGRTSRRKFDALAASLKRGSLQIISTPAIYLYDADDLKSRQLVMKNGVLGYSDPLWDPAGTAGFAASGATA